MTLLVTVAHGTRFAPGNAVAQEITDLASDACGFPGVGTYVELASPLFESVMQELHDRAVVVPLLLSTGYHMKVDLPAAVKLARAPVALGPALGPHPLLASAGVARLIAAGAEPGQPVLLVAAGSRNEGATHDLEAARDLLAEAWGGPVELSTISGIGERPADVVKPDHAVSPYLLAPGHFLDRAVEECAVATVAAVELGAHPDVVRLVADRAKSLAAAL